MEKSDYMLKSPCKKCKKRESGCRERCEKYEKFEERKKEVYKQRKMRNGFYE